MTEFEHEAVNHSVGEYVDGMAHTNGIESFWSMLKRVHKGTFHKISPKHLQRYVSEFAGKHNVRDSDTIAQMRDTVARLVGRNLLYGTPRRRQRAFVRRAVVAGCARAPLPAFRASRPSSPAPGQA